MESHNPYAPPSAQVGEVADAHAPTEVPRLWNPAAASRWSLLFTPIFGATLHMLNWRAMSDTQRAAQARRWLIGLCIVTGVMLVAAMLLPDTRTVDSAFRAAGLGVLIGWYLGIGREQHKAVAVRFGDDYPRRRWSGPLMFGVLGYMALFGVAVVIAIVLEQLGVAV